jgi:4'-phosphopantetheinyl transferase EntD
VIEELLPDTVAVASTREDLPDDLFPEERGVIEGAAEQRRREFTTGRALARQALGRLGIAPVAITVGERGAPVWPPGVVGSITHCLGYRACAVAKTDDLTALGIDAEVHAPLPAGVLDRVAFGPERTMVAGGGAGVHLDRVLFSAKEAVYKAWFPLTGRWLGFEDAEVDIDAGRFHARLVVPGPVTELHGRWRVAGGLVATAIVVPA